MSIFANCSQETVLTVHFPAQSMRFPSFVSLQQPSAALTSNSLLKRTSGLTLTFYQTTHFLDVYSAQAKLDSADGKAEPSLQSLDLLNEADLICHLWQQYVNMAILPLASSSVTIRREMTVFNNQTVSRIEGAANHIIQKLADCESLLISSEASLSLTSGGLVKPSSHGLPTNSPNKNGQISSPRTMTCRLPVSTPNPAKRVVRPWRKSEMQLRRHSAARTWRCSSLKLELLSIAYFLITSRSSQ